MQVRIDFTLLVDVYSHFFKVRVLKPDGSRVVWQLVHEYAQRGYERDDYNTKPDIPKVYAGRTKDNREFRFHIGQWKRFESLLYRNALSLMDCKVTRHDYAPFYEFDYQTNPDYVLHDYQQEALEFGIKEEDDDLNSRLIGMPMGKGKTVTLAFIIAALKCRAAFFLLPKYVEKWQSDLKHLLGLVDDDIYTVEDGSPQLRKLIAAAKENTLCAKVIIISQPTLNNFVKAQETKSAEDVIEDYGCLPEELLPLLGVGILGIDEVHDNLHMVFRLLLHTHVRKLVALSGTFLSEDPFVDFIQKTMFPKSVRFDKIQMDKYIQAAGIGYNFRYYNEQQIKTKEWGSNMYSHIAFERSIMKNKQYLNGYLKMIEHIVEVGYVQERKPGDTAVIYAATIKMCEYIKEHLKKKFRTLDIRTYVEKDPYENVIEADIRVTTIQSAGTAIDIPMLIFNLLTNTLFSHKSNLQVLGRLRQLKDRVVRYYCIYCKQIKKQVNGYGERKKLLKPKVKRFEDQDFPYPI